MKKLTVDEYVQALEKMKRGPRDRVGLLGELGVTGLGVTAGVVLSGSIAGTAGVATLAGSTTLATILGGVFVTTTPVGWVVGAAVAGGTLAYAACKLVRSGAKCDTLKDMTVHELEDRIRLLQKEAKLSKSNENKMPKIITGMQCLIANSRITQEKSTELLAAIEKGQISIDDAFEMVNGILNQHSSTINRPIN